MSHRESIPLRNGVSPHIETNNALRSLAKSGTPRNRGLSLGPTSMPSSPLASSSFSASSTNGSTTPPPSLSGPRLRGMSVSSPHQHNRAHISPESSRPMVKSRLRGLSISAHSPSSGRGLMVFEGPEEPLEDFAEFTFAQTPPSDAKPSLAREEPAISWWGQSSLAIGEQSGFKFQDSQEPLTSPDTPDPDLKSPDSIKSFFQLPSPPLAAASVAPDMAPDSLVVPSPKSVTEGELPDLMSDLENSPTSSLRRTSLPEDVDDLHDMVKELRTVLFSQKARFETLTSSLQDLAQRSAEWKHKLEMAQDIKVPALEAQIKQLKDEKAKLESQLQLSGPRIEGSGKQAQEKVLPHNSMPGATAGSSSSKTASLFEPDGAESVAAYTGAVDFSGPKGRRLSQILHEEVLSSAGPAPQEHRGSLFSLPGARAFSWSAAPVSRGSAFSASPASPRDSITEHNAETPRDVSNPSNDPIEKTEVSLMRSELQRLRARLEEATEARRASDDCLKALKELIGDGAHRTRSRNGSRSSISNIKLPPLPTADEEEDVEEPIKAEKSAEKADERGGGAEPSTSTDESASYILNSSTAASETPYSPLNTVRLSWGSLFNRSPSISLGSTQALLSKVAAIPLPASPLTSLKAISTDKTNEALESSQDVGSDNVDETVPVALIEAEDHTSPAAAASTTTAPEPASTSKTSAYVVTPALTRLGDWFRRSSIWEGPPTSSVAVSPAAAAEASGEESNADEEALASPKKPLAEGSSAVPEAAAEASTAPEEVSGDPAEPLDADREVVVEAPTSADKSTEISTEDSGDGSIVIAVTPASSEKTVSLPIESLNDVPESVTEDPASSEDAEDGPAEAASAGTQVNSTPTAALQSPPSVSSDTGSRSPRGSAPMLPRKNVAARARARVSLDSTRVADEDATKAA